ncbi:PrsW family intramembrane metalloprotease [Microlunatus soli]|uniref:Membrane proteinase PrsW, cleaves anti-sigma factor RsiW, M82 family n=1 Tax=Microlunatus soli TaxID=630515 RepID=A0A1H1XQN1_9ACTN|nr:PrsW family intramembrane metalloprotease [Microlunatus soli]SDT11538.1 Membrane proteinase PrsW, cleaves anti-sigma factor RsiW, M82 family [Microlunatus soli]
MSVAQNNQARRKAARSGLPAVADLSQPLPKRMITSRMFWVTVALLILYAACLVLLYRQVVPDQKVPGGRLIGLGHEAVPISAKYAAFTAVPLSLLFLWLDRFKPWRFWVWLMVFLWGACVATFFAAQINSWAASHLSIIGDGDPATGSRAAIYVAPWVEEFAKATALFWVAILMRYRWVSRLSGIALAGLAGAGFAFVENILYYGRVYRYAANTFGQVEPEQALQGLFLQRGVLTFFGHPLFTSMTGIGLAIGLRSKSKVVRVIAPLAGFCAAAFLHMSFNTAATLVQGNQLLLTYLFVALPALLAMIIFIVRQEFREGRLIRERLTDYARVGWVPTGDVLPMSRLRTRLRALWQSLFRGGHAPLATLRVQRAETELAYLRDSMTRGLIDDAGLEREKFLLSRIRAARGAAVIQPEARADYGRIRELFGRRRAIPSYAPPSYPGPAGIGGSMPAPGTAPIGPAATQYSKVDPNWKPPGE